MRRIPGGKACFGEAAAMGTLVPGDAAILASKNLELWREHGAVHAKGVIEDDNRTVAAGVVVTQLLAAMMKGGHDVPA
jgi:hypothetical protein